MSVIPVLRELFPVLSADQLEALAEMLGTLAREARYRASDLKASEASRKAAGAQVAAVAAAGAQAAELIASGQPRPRAVDEIAGAQGFPRESVERSLILWARSREAIAVAHRRALIVRAAGQGFTDAQIAKSFGLSTRTVQRALEAAGGAAAVLSRRVREP